jgi:hypothetical protein
MINLQQPLGAVLRLDNLRLHAEKQNELATSAKQRHMHYLAQIEMATDRDAAIAYIERFPRAPIATESYNALCDFFLREGYMPTAYQLARECCVPEDNGTRRLRRLIELCVVERTKGGIALVSIADSRKR